jgi:hypothetical protein
LKFVFISEAVTATVECHNHRIKPNKKRRRKKKGITTTYLSPAAMPQIYTAVLISIEQCKATVHRRKMTTNKETTILSFQYSAGAFHGSKIHRIGISTQ